MNKLATVRTLAGSDVVETLGIQAIEITRQGSRPVASLDNIPWRIQVPLLRTLQVSPTEEVDAPIAPVTCDLADLLHDDEAAQFAALAMKIAERLASGDLKPQTPELIEESNDP